MYIAYLYILHPVDVADTCKSRLCVGLRYGFVRVGITRLRLRLYLKIKFGLMFGVVVSGQVYYSGNVGVV